MKKKEMRAGGGTACLLCDALRRRRPVPSKCMPAGQQTEGTGVSRISCEQSVHPSRMHGVIPRFGRAAYGGTTRTPRTGAGMFMPVLVAGLMDMINAI